MPSCKRFCLPGLEGCAGALLRLQRLTEAAPEGLRESRQRPHAAAARPTTRLPATLTARPNECTAAHTAKSAPNWAAGRSRGSQRDGSRAEGSCSIRCGREGGTGAVGARTATNAVQQGNSGTQDHQNPMHAPPRPATTLQRIRDPAAPAQAAALQPHARTCRFPSASAIAACTRCNASATFGSMPSSGSPTLRSYVTSISGCSPAGAPPLLLPVAAPPSAAADEGGTVQRRGAGRLLERCGRALAGRGGCRGCKEEGQRGVRRGSCSSGGSSGGGGGGRGVPLLDLAVLPALTPAAAACGGCAGRARRAIAARLGAGLAIRLGCTSGEVWADRKWSERLCPTPPSEVASTWGAQEPHTHRSRCHRDFSNPISPSGIATAAQRAPSNPRRPLQAGRNAGQRAARAGAPGGPPSAAASGSSGGARPAHHQVGAPAVPLFARPEFHAGGMHAPRHPPRCAPCLQGCPGAAAAAGAAAPPPLPARPCGGDAGAGSCHGRGHPSATTRGTLLAGECGGAGQAHGPRQ